MILTVVGTILMLSGIALVVYQTAQNWTTRHLSMKREVPPTAIVLLGIGMVMVLIGTSGSPPPAQPSP